jgi:hypothetical protein
MMDPLVSMVSYHRSPTLWPFHPNDRTLSDFALEASIKENRLLKALVVNLSDIILEFIVSKK